jgi:hypothetical protein
VLQPAPKEQQQQQQWLCHREQEVSHCSDPSQTPSSSSSRVCLHLASTAAAAGVGVGAERAGHLAAVDLASPLLPLQRMTLLLNQQQQQQQQQQG